jgi:outer membrane protein OmpA-like peptidoglycan-associated protein
MAAQRRDTDRGLDRSVERMWRIYADEVGIPSAEPMGPHESLPPEGDHAIDARGPARRPGGSIVRVVGAMVAGIVVAVAGVGLWQGVSRPPDRAERSSPIAASTPAPGVSKVSEAVATITPNVVETKPVVRKKLSLIPFDFGSDHINKASKAQLNALAGLMRANPDWQVAIEGHADAHGAPEYNRSLSERRAQAVKAYLQISGISTERLSAVGFSSSRPVASNDAVGSALNRRVEIYRR